MNLGQDTRTREALSHVIQEELACIAPDFNFNQLNPALAFREQVDLDSMDFIGFLIRIRRRTGVEIPVTDYSKIQSWNELIEYIEKARSQMTI